MDLSDIYDLNMKTGNIMLMTFADSEQFTRLTTQHSNSKAAAPLNIKRFISYPISDVSFHCVELFIIEFRYSFVRDLAQAE